MEGLWVFGVRPVRVENGQTVSAGPTCWSNNRACTSDGKKLYIRVREWKQKLIWKIIWR